MSSSHNRASNRSTLDVFIETGAASIYGSMMGLEVEAEGNMAVTGAVIDMALRRFLEDVAAEGGPDIAAVYAARIIETLKIYLPDNVSTPKKRS